MKRATKPETDIAAAPAPAPVDLPVAQMVPLADIFPSANPVQARRRARFNREALVQLTDNVRQMGVVQPILIRPANDVRAPARFEIVAGERRFLAARDAGLSTIPAVIRDLTDADALSLQLVENLQREGLHELEEGEGYLELMRLRACSTDAIADLIGKSRSYVYNRIRLMKLHPAAMAAVQSGEIDISKGLLLARIKGEKLQGKALELILQRGEYLTHRRLVEELRDKFMEPLAAATFPFDDPATRLQVGNKTFADFHGACSACPHNSANDPELAAEIAAAGNTTAGDAGAHMCTDTACYALKTAAWQAKRLADYTAAGKTVLTGDAARQIFPGHYGSINGYVDLDAEAYNEDGLAYEAVTGDKEPDENDEGEADAWYRRFEQWKSPTWRQLLGAAAEADAVLAQDPHKKNQLRTLLSADAVAKHIKAIKLDAKLAEQLDMPEKFKPVAPGETAAERAERERAARARAEARELLEKNYREQTMLAIHQRWKGPVTRADLIAIADRIVSRRDELVKLCYGGKLELAKLDDLALSRLIVEGTVANCMERWCPDRGPLFRLAERLKIDHGAILDNLQKAAKEKNKQAKAAGKTPAATGKTKAGKKGGAA